MVNGIDGEFFGLPADRLMAGQPGQPCAQQADRIMTLTESFVAYQLTGLWLGSQDSHVHSKLTRLREREEERKREREHASSVSNPSPSLLTEGFHERITNISSTYS